MSTQMPSVGMIALGVFIAAFVLLMLAGHPFLAALLFAMVVAAGAGIFFLVVHDRSDGRRDGGAARAASWAHPAAGLSPSASETSPALERVPGAAAQRASAPRPEPASAPTAETAAGEPVEPARLPAPRGAEADDLKRIKGIGPLIEETLNRIGIYHLDQIAAWGPAEVAWMDEQEGFRGRVSRDDWAGQARRLVEGGDVETARRGDKGGDRD